MRQTPNKIFDFRTFCIAFIGSMPIFLSWLYKEFISPRQPWGYFDHVETLYYYSGIVLNDGIFSGHADNPAAPLQLISALIVFFTGKLPADYELFLSYSHLVVILTIILGAYLLAKKLFAGLSFICVITAISIYFISPSSIQYSHYWGPEALYFLLGIVFFVQLKKVLEQDNQLQVSSFFFAGFVLGICLSEKFVFLAWIPALLGCLTIRYYQDVDLSKLIKILLSSSFGIIFGFVLITPFLWGQYPYMFEWIINIIIRDGAYGSGSISTPDFVTVLSSWLKFFFSAKLWSAIIILLLVLVLYSCISDKKIVDNKARRINLSYLAFFVIANAFTLLSVARQIAPRYLLPMGLTVILLFYLVSRTQIYKKKTIKLGILTIVFVILIKQILFDASTHNLREANTKSFQHSIEEILQELPDRENLVIVYSFRVPVPSYSLRQHQALEQHQLILDEHFPNEGYYNLFTAKPYVRLPGGHNAWDVLVIRDSDLQSFPDKTGNIFAQTNGYAVVLAKDFETRYKL